MAPDDDDDDDDAAEADEAATKSKRRGSRPMDEPSEKQLGFVRALKDQVKLSDADFQKLLAEVTEDPDVTSASDLSRRQASQVIDELMIRAKEKGIDLDASAPRATEKQVGFILSLKRRAHLTDVELAALLDEVAGVKTAAEVSKKDASAVIDRLLALVDKSKPGATDAKKSGASAAKSKPPASKPKKKQKPAPAPVDGGDGEGGTADDEDRPPDKEPPPAEDDDDPPF